MTFLITLSFTSQGFSISSFDYFVALEDGLLSKYDFIGEVPLPPQEELFSASLEPKHEHTGPFDDVRVRRHPRSAPEEEP